MGGTVVVIKIIVKSNYLGRLPGLHIKIINTSKAFIFVIIENKEVSILGSEVLVRDVGGWLFFDLGL